MLSYIICLFEYIQVGNVQKVGVQTVLAKSASSPAIIRVPKASIPCTVPSPNSIPISIQQAVSSVSGNTTPRIIKITRVGAHGAIKIPQHGGAITLGSLAGANLAGKKIIIKRSVQPGVGGASAGGLNLQIPTVSELITSNHTGVTTPLLQRAFSPQLQTTSSPVQIVNRTGLTGGSLQNAVSLLQRSGESLLIPRTTSALHMPSVIGVSSQSKNNVVVNVSGIGMAGTNVTNIKTNLSHKDLSRLWSNDDIKLKNFSAPSMKIISSVSQVMILISLLSHLVFYQYNSIVM